MKQNAENLARRIIGNALLYLLVMIVFVLRACYTIIYILLSICAIVPLAVLVDIIRNKVTFANAITEAIGECVNEVKDIFK